MADKQGKNRGNGKRWEPGQSGNPAGRPKKVSSIADILRKIGEENGGSKEYPEDTKQESVLRQVYFFAAKGKAWAVQFIADRTEGKVVQPVDVDSNQSVNILVTQDQGNVDGDD